MWRVLWRVRAAVGVAVGAAVGSVGGCGVGCRGRATCNLRGGCGGSCSYGPGRGSPLPDGTSTAGTACWAATPAATPCCAATPGSTCGGSSRATQSTLAEARGGELPCQLERKGRLGLASFGGATPERHRSSRAEREEEPRPRRSSGGQPRSQRKAPSTRPLPTRLCPGRPLPRLELHAAALAGRLLYRGVHLGTGVRLAGRRRRVRSGGSADGERGGGR